MFHKTFVRLIKDYAASNTCSRSALANTHFTIILKYRDRNDYHSSKSIGVKGDKRKHLRR